MRYESGQFGAMDSRDNRKEVFILFERLGAGLPEEIGNSLRAGFLKALVDTSTTGFAHRDTVINPCSATEAYRLFGAITGCLGVDVEKAAVTLQAIVRDRDAFLAGVFLDEILG